MKQDKKTKTQLIAELQEMRRRVAELEQPETERKRAEEESRHSKELLRTVLDIVPAFICAKNLDGRFILVNKKLTDFYGTTVDEMTGLLHADICEDEKELQAMLDADREVIESGKLKLIPEETMENPDGSITVLETYKIPFSTHDEPAVLIAATDITERKRAEEALRDSKEKHRTIIENLPLGVLTLEQDGVITSANPAFTKIFDLPSDKVVGKSIINSLSFIQDINMIKYFNALVEKSTRFDFESQAVTIPTGKLIYLRVRGIPIQDFQGNTKSFLVVMGDITERKLAEEEKAKLEKQLRRSQKMETIGTMAGGIAHDFNNILTPILGYTDMALSSLPPSNPVYDDLKHVLTGAHRAKDLVQQILTFSRQLEQERQPLALHLIIKEAIQLLRPSIPSTIEIRQRIDTTCEKVLADPTQMHQVLVNLCNNSFHAMEQKGGVLTIELKQVEVDAATAQFNPNLEQKEYVRLAVSDTGIGMDEAAIERIFEPFYTTKAVDKGTGLGLSVVHGIVRGHHGDIIVYSEPAKGSSFHVYLPISTATVSDIDTKEDKTIQGGQESILVVDDEEMIIDMLKSMLERLGYHVDARNSSIEALKAFRERPERYDLVITDLTMPNMTGLDLAKELHKIRSELAIIIMTGYGENITADILEHYGINKIIGKPIEMQKLAVAIREVIDK